jgi:NAD(P)H-hydrate epimerase
MKINNILKRKNNSKKGDHGRVLIVGGSEKYVGALTLAGIAALRITDWVTIAAPEKVAWAINTLSPDLVTVKLKGTHIQSSHIKKLTRLAKGHDVLLLGIGMGLTSNSTARALAKLPLPKVIDADALKAVSIKQTKNAILTPHQKEFTTLLKNSKLNKNNFQKELKENILLIKGPRDFIFSQKKQKINNKGNPGMTRAGTGDVLAGVIAGLLARKVSLFNAADQGVLLTTKAADQLNKKHKYCYLASELADDIKRYI